MINVLQSWQEVGDATLTLQREGLPVHPTPQKNWDHFLLYRVISPKDRGIDIVDLGCGEGHTLRLLHALGFQSILGLDLSIGLRLRLAQAAGSWRKRTLQPSFRLRASDICRTDLADQSISLAVSVSTIEHGVDMSSFFREASRILKPDGLLFITTDYWEEKIQTDESIMSFGLPWKIFSAAEIEALIDLARENGLELVSPGKPPSCNERTVRWQQQDYTFISLLFRKLS